MNTKQTNTLYHWKAIRDVLGRFPEAWKGSPVFADRVARLEACWEEAQGFAGVQKQDTQGTTLSKNTARDLVTELALQAAYNLQAWAEDHNDAATVAAMSFSRSQLDDEADAALAVTLNNIITAVDAHRPELDR